MSIKRITSQRRRELDELVNQLRTQLTDDTERLYVNADAAFRAEESPYKRFGCQESPAMSRCVAAARAGDPVPWNASWNHKPAQPRDFSDPHAPHQLHQSPAYSQAIRQGVKNWHLTLDEQLGGLSE